MVYWEGRGKIKLWQQLPLKKSRSWRRILRVMRLLSGVFTACSSLLLSDWRGSVIKEFVDPLSRSLTSPLVLVLPSLTFLICLYVSKTNADTYVHTTAYAHTGRVTRNANIKYVVSVHLTATLSLLSAYSENAGMWLSSKPVFSAA